MFPMTTDGFEERTPEQIAARATADAEFMQILYARMGAGDREGLMKIVEDATSPFQKALGLASIEHILIQAKEPAGAEYYANLIPTITASTTLAKAEALNGAAGAWIRAGDSAKAQTVYDAAVALVQSVSTLQFGKVSVLTDIAVSQFKGGLVATSGATLKLALSLAPDIPVVILPGTLARVMVRQTHSRNAAYQKIVNAGVRTHNLTIAFEAAEEWSKLGGRGGPELVRACMNMDQDEAATEYAHKISDKKQRADALLTLAESLLDNAGVPR